MLKTNVNQNYKTINLTIYGFPIEYTKNLIMLSNTIGLINMIS